MPYYNTTAEPATQCVAFAETNMNQDDTVLEVAKKLKRPFTPSDIYRKYPVANTSLTSIRRSIHTLYHKLHSIEPTGHKRNSLYGRPELEYSVNP